MPVPQSVMLLAGPVLKKSMKNNFREVRVLILSIFKHTVSRHLNRPSLYLETSGNCRSYMIPA